MFLIFVCILESFGIKNSVRKMQHSCPDILAGFEETGQQLEALEGRLPSKYFGGCQSLDCSRSFRARCTIYSAISTLSFFTAKIQF